MAKYLKLPNNINYILNISPLPVPILINNDEKPPISFHSMANFPYTRYKLYYI